MRSIDVKTQVGAAVRAWRTRLGFSQEELAERAGLHRTYISDIERGERNVSIESIERLAQALQIPVSTLFVEPRNSESPKSAAPISSEDLVEILYVEDNPDDVELTLRALRSANMPNAIHVVRDGAEALDFLFCAGRHAHRKHGHQPKMVLLDLNLPRIDGLEVLRRIKSNERTRDIPVVVLTVSRRHPDIVTCRQFGAEAYITKPVNLEGLGEVARKLNMQWALLKATHAEQA